MSAFPPLLGDKRTSSAPSSASALRGACLDEGPLIRCTVEGSTPNWAAVLRTLRPACIAEVQKGGRTTPGNTVRVCVAQRGYLQQLPQ
jgi:hypothetical protein